MNWATLLEELERSLASRQKPAGLILLYLENIKRLASGLGVGADDAIMAEVAERLRKVGDSAPIPARRSQASAKPHRTPRKLTVSRVSADEIAVLVPGPSDGAVATAVAEDIVNRLSVPVAVADHVVGLDVFAGVTTPKPGDDAAEIMRRARIALEDARLNGGPQVSKYTPEMATATGEMLALETRLRQALETGELFLLYQPQVSFHTGRVEAVEALVRWDHPALGTVLPGRFITLAEERGMGLAICDRVMRGACRQLKAWHEAGLGDLDLALNLTSDSLELGEVRTHLADILAETGIDPAHLELEITERFVMDDPEHHAALFQGLRDLGVGLALDDFGTGHSTLTFLQRLPVNRLKIDRAFVSDLPDNDQDMALVKGIIGLAHGLGLKVVAEGVENEAQRAALAALGCDSYQGFLFAAPLTADAVAEVVTAAQRPRATAGGQAVS